jgi:tetratricopeptide (TPR) repeat protein
MALLSAIPAHGLRLTLCVLAMLGAASCRNSRQESGPLASYVTDPAVIRYEFRHFAGREPEPKVLAEIESAGKAARSADYRGALATLSGMAPNAPVPAVYANLGILYAAVNDPLNAREAFQKALRRDPSYRAARDGLDRLKAAGIDEDLPVTQEIEPNNSLLRANRIALEATVSGEVAADGDVDAFRFVSPPKPRDVLEISIVNRSTTLVPTLRIFDSDQRFVLWNKEATRQGSNAAQFFAPGSSATYYVEVWGQNRTAGAYAIRVRALKAYDGYEPNDDIAHPAAIEPGATLDAGIMDARDTDYYRFTSPRTGTATVRIENHSATLLPAVTIYGPDLRLTGFGPEVRDAGAGLTHSFAITAGEARFVQVWSRGASSGRYSISVK